HPPLRLKVYFLSLAVAMTILIGLTRIYLGVHYPTDVLAGWAAGAAWASLWWAGVAWWRHRQRRRAPATGWHAAASGPKNLSDIPPAGARMLRRQGAAGARDRWTRNSGAPMRKISTRDRSISSSRRGSFLTGCLIVLAVLLIVGVIAGIWVAANYRGWLASWTTLGVHAALSKSDLSDEQRAEFMVEVEALALDYKEKRISERELADVFKEIAESPPLPLGAVYAVEKGYVQPS